MLETAAALSLVGDLATPFLAEQQDCGINARAAVESPLLEGSKQRLDRHLMGMLWA